MALGAFLVSLFGFMSLGIPIALVLVICSIVLMVLVGQFDLLSIAQAMVSGTNSFPLMAIPFFMLAGEIMSQGGLSARIVNASNLAVGRYKGGLGYVAILASIVFSGLSGSAVADAAALGGILIPMMRENGYKIDRATAFICAGAVIAPIIPPSIPMIVLGTATNLSVTRLFMSGLIPGAILGLALMVVWFFVVRKDGYTDTMTFTKEERNAILKDSMPALMMPVLIVGGIRFGIFTPTEAGAFAVVYSLIVCKFVYKELDFHKFGDIFSAASKSTATVMLIVAAANAVGFYITMAQVPAQMVTTLMPFIDKPMLLLLIINMFLFVLGMVMDLTPNILIFGPVLFPVIQQAGIDPYFFALIMCLNLCIGLITPPVGTVLYVGCGVSKIDIVRLSKAIIPFLIVEIVILLLLTFFPSLVMAPLNLIMGS
ncbi:TRAP transporter large permease [Sedimentibacter hydroxybenzoicus DSM 7310]|uniref:TRAP transporter large permease n=1 Tax=Sedimentibacter hydroxybenzoicus DSM 7310 TaxID=1123245 RepID=A0A974GUX0_SEDHY|nr:TRAP transporter large permease [Sedimentibacter hydroxybenzoicus]NYB72773.1 TRAP transporter large permease [Sedimentibacter hydroxybenzoicus DSM 7310]